MTTSNIDPSWKSIYKAGGISALLAGAFAIIDALLQAIIHPALVTYTSNTLANTSNTFITPAQFLLFVANNTILYNSWYSSFALSVVSLLPVLLALYIVLSNTNRGFALIGSALGIMGTGIILASLANNFFLVREAVTYQNGCTPCAAAALAGAAATGSADLADLIGSSLLAVGVVILSILMFRGLVSGRRIGSLGLLAGVYLIVGGTLSSLSGDLFFYAGLVLYFLLAVWLFAVGLKLYDLP